MMYGNSNSQEKEKDPSPTHMAEQPELLKLLKRFQIAAAQFGGLTYDISSKLQEVYMYEEKVLAEPDNNREDLDQNPPSFSTDLLHLIHSVEEYNRRLERSLRHLRKII